MCSGSSPTSPAGSGRLPTGWCGGGAIAARSTATPPMPASTWPASVGQGLESGFRRRRRRREQAVTWSRTLERSLCYSYGCWEVLEQQPAPADRPDRRPLRRAGLRAFRAGLLRRPLPVVNFLDYYYHAHQNDLADETGRRHCRRPTFTGGGRSAAIELLDLEQCDLALDADQLAAPSLPAEYRDEFLVLHDGVDTPPVRRRPGTRSADRPRSIAGRRRSRGRRGSSASWPGRSTGCAGSTGSWPWPMPCFAPRRRGLRRRGRPDRPAAGWTSHSTTGITPPSFATLSRRSIPSGSGSWAGDTGDRRRGPGRQRPALAPAGPIRWRDHCWRRWPRAASCWPPTRRLTARSSATARPGFWSTSRSRRAAAPGARRAGRPGRAPAAGRRRGRAGPVSAMPRMSACPARRAVLDAGRRARRR